MIHIATVHWKEDRWIDVQLAYLHRHVAEPFRVYAWLNDLPIDHRAKFHYATAEPVDTQPPSRQHAIKLNLLADLIYFDSDRDRDLIVFLDGDAFPIGDAIGLARRKLAEYPLVAVQRRENNGDVQPHPCFCATTVGFWKRIGGDWNQGYTWQDDHGRPTTDTGGNLLGILKRHGVEWYPLLRSNRVNLHGLWFGVYDGVVYHHGAAFRWHFMDSRYDCREAQARVRGTWRAPVVWAIDRLKVLPCGGVLQRIHPLRALERRLFEDNRRLSESVFAKIVHDPLFYKELV
jgi:hypothetical protein